MDEVTFTRRGSASVFERELCDDDDDDAVAWCLLEWLPDGTGVDCVAVSVDGFVDDLLLRSKACTVGELQLPLVPATTGDFPTKPLLPAFSKSLLDLALLL